MSEEVSYKGEFIDLSERFMLDLEELCELICLIHNYKQYEDEEFLTTLLANNDDYFTVAGRLFKITSKIKIDVYETFISKDSDKYQFVSTFYNGGTYLHECLEDELLKNIKLK